MTLYTFYPRGRRGAATVFETYDLLSDGEAFEQADAILVRHFSADYVEVWAEDRAVVSRHRDQPILRPVLSA